MIETRQRGGWAAFGAAGVCAVALAGGLTAAPTPAVSGSVAGELASPGSRTVSAQTLGLANKPIRLAPFGPDAVLVADIFNHAIRVVSRDGPCARLSGGPIARGMTTAPQRRRASPRRTAWRVPDGRILVAEAEGHTLRVLSPRAGAPGEYDVRTLAGRQGNQAASTALSPPHVQLAARRAVGRGWGD